MALRRALLVVSIALAVIHAAAAQERPIPADAKRGYIKPDREVLISIDGAPARLAPGAIVRDGRNLIIVPAAMPREGAWADYLEDRNGQVSAIWLLTAAERARPRPAAKR